VVTDENGRVTINVPPNDNGNGFVCYSRDGLGGGFSVESQTVRQDFEGAPDLDILPALSGKTVKVGRIWSGANRAITASLIADRRDWTQATAIQLEVLSPSGDLLRALTLRVDSRSDDALQATSGAAGFYALQLTTSNTPSTNLNPTFKLSVTYQADAHFETSAGGRSL
jgi:hypothetical protein